MRAWRVVLLVIAGFVVGAGVFVLAGVIDVRIGLASQEPRWSLAAVVERPPLTKLALAAVARDTSSIDVPVVPTAEPVPTATATTRPPAVAESDPDLVASLDTALTEALASVAVGPFAPQLGVAVFDEDGNLLYDRGGGTPLLPASAIKLVTAAAALSALGPDYQFATVAAATAAPGPDGVLAGDLVLIGGGDPTLASPTFAGQVFPERPHTPLSALADQIVAAGVTRVTGAVVGDPTVFADEPLAAGWLPDYLEDLDATYVSGLTVDGGRQLFVEDGVLQGRPAPDPAVEAAAALLVLLGERGIAVDGGHHATRTPPAAPVILGEVRSAPLAELLRFTVQRSDNHLADAIFRTLGRLGGRGGTWAAAADAAQATLAPLQLDWSGVVLADGSGLSREDRTPAAFLAALDLQMSRSNLRDAWLPLQAVGGETGTLRNRLVGTIAEGRFRGKTGSLRDVRALAGSVEGPDGQALHFAAMGNALDDSGVTVTRRLQDLIVLALVAEIYSCDRVGAAADLVPPTEVAAEPPPLPEYACAA